MTDFLSLIKKSRSIRIFDNSRKISEEQLLNIVETTRFTPSSSNLQPLKYRLVVNGDEADTVRKYTRWAGLLPDYTGPGEDESPPAYIIICLDLDISSNESVFNKDVGIVAQTMSLALCEKGIGSCMIGSFDKEKIHLYLKLSDNLIPKLILAVGYPLQNTVIEDANDSVRYYRDKQGTHHVPKRKLKDIIVK